MKHVFSVWVQNKPGVTSRVSGLFRRRGLNIDSFIGSATEDERFSRLTITIEGDDQVISQVQSQIKRLEDVISIEDIQKEQLISKVLLFIKVKAEFESRVGIMVIADAFSAKVIEIKADYLIIEALDTEERVSEMIEIFRPYGIIELVKTGIVAMKK